MQHNDLLQCIGPAGSFIFLMLFEHIKLSSFDVSLGRDVFAYYNEVLASMAVTTGELQSSELLNLTNNSRFGAT